jgi:peptidoglycan/LPS O-acetylase OafA/YrhL
MPGLDGVRGLAILMVLAVHFVGDATPQTTIQQVVIKAAGYGMLGVDLFFVLSGFLITGLLLDAKTSPHYFRNFYARRTLRIFPLYYFVLTALFLLLPRIVALPPALERAHEHQGWLWTYTANFYTGSQSSWSALSYVSHFWSLAIEEHFYLLWPMVVFFQSRRTLERTSAAVIVFGLALRVVLSLTGTSELTISVLTPCRIDTLCVGALMAAVARRPGGAAMLGKRCGRAAVVLAGALIMLSAWCAVTKVALPVLHQLRSTMVGLFFGAVSLVGARARPGFAGRVLHTRPLRFFGKFSYGLYVYHGLLAWYLHDLDAEKRLDAALGGHWLTILARAGLGTFVSTAVAFVSFQCLEKPFLALKGYFEVAAPYPERTRAAPEIASPDHRDDRGEERAYACTPCALHQRTSTYNAQTRDQ